MATIFNYLSNLYDKIILNTSTFKLAFRGHTINSTRNACIFNETYKEIPTNDNNTFISSEFMKIIKSNQPNMWREMISDLIISLTENNKITLLEDHYLHHNNISSLYHPSLLLDIQEINNDLSFLIEIMYNDIFNDHIFYYNCYYNIETNVYDLSIIICDRKKPISNKFVFDIYRFIYHLNQSENLSPQIMIK